MLVLGLPLLWASSNLLNALIPPQAVQRGDEAEFLVLDSTAGQLITRRYSEFDRCSSMLIQPFEYAEETGSTRLGHSEFTYSYRNDAGGGIVTISDDLRMYEYRIEDGCIIPLRRKDVILPVFLFSLTLTILLLIYISRRLPGSR